MATHAFPIIGRQEAETADGCHPIAASFYLKGVTGEMERPGQNPSQASPAKHRFIFALCSPRARRAFRFPFRLACWLTATTCLCLGFYAFRPEPGGSATTQASRPITLQGPAAIQQLKDTGSYDSLAAAIAATRYQIKAAPSQPSRPAAPFYANNPGQQLRAAFTPEEVRVSATQTKTDSDELRLRLTGYGYGDQLGNAHARRNHIQRQSHLDHKIRHRRSQIRNH